MEGAQRKDMPTIGEYLQIWKLKVSTTKAVLAVFHLYNKEDKRELEVSHNNETCPFAPNPSTYLGGMLDRTSQHHALCS